MVDREGIRVVAETTEKAKLTELAAIVSDALQYADIVATLSGGTAVSIFTDNRYQSEDLDFVTGVLVDGLKAVLEPLEFKHTGRRRLSVFERRGAQGGTLACMAEAHLRKSKLAFATLTQRRLFLPMC